MFQNLSQRFGQFVQRCRGLDRITPENIDATLSEVRIALIDADVALGVIDTFIQQVREEALGQAVSTQLLPGQAFIKIVHQKLTQLMGDANSPLQLTTHPSIILIAGLQGSGKTTTTAKLAHWIKREQQKSVLLVSTDTQRPAAIEQLAILAKQINAPCYPSDSTQSPVKIAEDAVNEARRQNIDVVIIDTAGRLHIDQPLMDEVKRLHQAVKPVETLFVVDSMTGQDAANTAKAFHDTLPLTGIILTKTDGDARGGAALSVKYLTGKPIKFIGVGEKIDALESFHPERMASRILDMGDVLSLVEAAERKIDKQKAAALTQKFQQGEGFNFNDFLTQIEEMQKMGGMAGLVAKLPGFNTLPDAAKQRLNDEQFQKARIIIQSMTAKERIFPKLLNQPSRKKRVTQGSGTQIPDLNKLIRQFEQMQKTMKKMRRPGTIKKLMSQMPAGFSPEDLM